MTNNVDNQKSKTNSHARDHLANERTFLAWVRTSIGIMAFGFVVEKFALFMRELTLLLGKEGLSISLSASSSFQGYSSVFGIFLVALGVLICLMAFIKYKNVEKQIEDEKYIPSIFLNVMITLSVVLIGVFLVTYLTNSV